MTKNNINTQKSVINTLAYFRTLNTPLTLVQIGRYLIDSNPSTSLRSPQNDINNDKYLLSEINNVLKDLIDKNIVMEQKGLYWLSLRDPSAAPQDDKVNTPQDDRNKDDRKDWLKFVRSEKNSQRKINKALKAIKLFSLVPFLRGLFICGSVARKVSRRDSDIDFLILTKPDRTWTVRLWLTFFAYLLGKKTRPFQADRKDKFCLNHYRSSSNLKLEENLRDLYSAEEYASMLNVYSANRTDRKFFKKNKRWMSSFLPNFPFSKLPISPANGKLFSSVRKILEKMLGGKIGHIIEWLVYQLQTRKIKLGNSGTLTGQRVVAEKEVIMFHLNPRAPLVLSRYQQIIKNYE
jgi:hypothetical protein